MRLWVSPDAGFGGDSVGRLLHEIGNVSHAIRVDYCGGYDHQRQSVGDDRGDHCVGGTSVWGVRFVGDRYDRDGIGLGDRGEVYALLLVVGVLRGRVLARDLWWFWGGYWWVCGCFWGIFRRNCDWSEERKKVRVWDDLFYDVRNARLTLARQVWGAMLLL